jgi:hypothetical protein
VDVGFKPNHLKSCVSCLFLSCSFIFQHYEFFQNQLAEIMTNIHKDNVEAKFQRSMKEFQTNVYTALGKHNALFDSIKTQLFSLVASYNNLRRTQTQGETNVETNNARVLLL